MTKAKIDMTLHEYFHLSPERLQELKEDFVEELNYGLIKKSEEHGCLVKSCVDLKRESDFKMLDSYVSSYADVGAHGTYYAVDFGGTQLRVSRIRLDGKGKYEIEDIQSVSMLSVFAEYEKGALDPKVEGRQLFNFLASCLKKIYKKSSGLAKIGFTFSFPVNQTGIREAFLMTWTKEFETGQESDDPIEGKDVGKMFMNSLKEPFSLASVTNDTIATLMAGIYVAGDTSTEEPEVFPCRFAVILGTGFNACYVEKDAIANYGYVSQIVNIEAGNFERNLPTCPIDDELDAEDDFHRGQQRLEKMMSGAYIGEIVQRFLTKKWYSKYPSYATSSKIKNLSTYNLSSALDSDDKYKRTCEMLGDNNLSFDEFEIILKTAKAVFTRSAALAASVIAAVRIKSLSDNDGMTVIIDGSLYNKSAFFACQLHANLKSILGPLFDRLKIKTLNEASSLGSAVLAATVKE